MSEVSAGRVVGDTAKKEELEQWEGLRAGEVHLERKPGFRLWKMFLARTKD